MFGRRRFQFRREETRGGVETNPSAGHRQSDLAGLKGRNKTGRIERRVLFCCWFCCCHRRAFNVGNVGNVGFSRTYHPLTKHIITAGAFNVRYVKFSRIQYTRRSFANQELQLPRPACFVVAVNSICGGASIPVQNPTFPTLPPFSLGNWPFSDVGFFRCRVLNVGFSVGWLQLLKTRPFRSLVVPRRNLLVFPSDSFSQNSPVSFAGCSVGCSVG
jgi:hypothetical protein